MKKEDRLYFSIFLKKSLQLQKLFTLILKKYLESIEGITLIQIILGMNFAYNTVERKGNAISPGHKFAKANR